MKAVWWIQDRRVVNSAERGWGLSEADKEGLCGSKWEAEMAMVERRRFVSRGKEPSRK